MKVRFGQSTLVLLAMIVSAFVSAPEGRRQTSCLATTTNGMVQGIDNGVSCSFLGIPFAAPPLGNLRWKPPQPAAPWPATLNANAGVGLSAGQPRREHDGHGQRELPEVERLDAGSGACVVGAGHRLDSHRRLHGGFAEHR